MHRTLAGRMLLRLALLLTIIVPTAPAHAQSLSLAPACVVGGNPVEGTVALSKPAHASVAVKLASNSQYATVPATVTIPAGESSVSFTVTTGATRFPTFAKITAKINTAAATAYARISPPTGYALSAWPHPYADGFNSDQSFPINIRGTAVWGQDFSGDNTSIMSGRVGAQTASVIIGPDGTLYFVGLTSTMDEDKTLDKWILFAANPKSGKIVRQYIFDGDGGGVPTIAMGANGLIYAMTAAADGTGYLSAVKSDTMEIAWRQPMGAAINYVEPTGALGIGPDGTVCVVGNSGVITAFDGDSGSQKWQTHIDTIEFGSAPVIGLDGTVYVQLEYGWASRFLALDAATGQVRWTINLADSLPYKSSYTLPVLGPDGTLYVGAGSRIYAIDSQTGQVKWHYYLVDNWARLALGANGTLYAMTIGYVGTEAICALNAATGSLLWKFNNQRYQFDGWFTLCADGTVWCSAADTGTMTKSGGWAVGLFSLNASTGKFIRFAEAPGSAFVAAPSGEAPPPTESFTASVSLRSRLLRTGGDRAGLRGLRPAQSPAVCLRPAFWFARMPASDFGDSSAQRFHLRRRHRITTTFRLSALPRLPAGHLPLERPTSRAMQITSHDIHCLDAMNEITTCAWICYYS